MKRAAEIQPAADWAAYAHTFQAPYLSGAVMLRRGFTSPEQHATAIMAHLQCLTDRAGLWKRVRAHDLASELRDGIKSLHHFYPAPVKRDYAPVTAPDGAGLLDIQGRRQLYSSLMDFGISGGWLLARQEKEGRAFGLSSDATPAERPIYGYATECPDGWLRRPDPEMQLGQKLKSLEAYGTVALRFKEDVRPFTTISFQDTSCMCLEAVGPLTAPLGRPAIGSNGHPVQGGQPLGSPGIPCPVEAVRVEAWPWAYHADPLDVPSLNRLPSYAELQFHGTLAPDSIREIVTLHALPQEALELAEALGVPVRVIPK